MKVRVKEINCGQHKAFIPLGSSAHIFITNMPSGHVRQSRWRRRLAVPPSSPAIGGQHLPVQRSRGGLRGGLYHMCMYTSDYRITIGHWPFSEQISKVATQKWDQLELSDQICNHILYSTHDNLNYSALMHTCMLDAHGNNFKFNPFCLKLYGVNWSVRLSKLFSNSRPVVFMF